MARPGVRIALEEAGKRPDQLLTVFDESRTSRPPPGCAPPSPPHFNGRLDYPV
ncbi:hypothetical protein [Kitasatospora indigofera]|uniref:hypothetical protein n=1 Tax=Kitasatospora indigofera TaxID=67307 RepID=UPI00324E5136